MINLADITTNLPSPTSAGFVQFVVWVIAIVGGITSFLILAHYIKAFHKDWLESKAVEKVRESNGGAYATKDMVSQAILDQTKELKLWMQTELNKISARSNRRH